MMDGALNREENRVLDGVIARRRSTRAFTAEAPPKEWIEQIILAGLEAPYAGLAAKEGLPYRLFRVIPQGPKTMQAMEMIKEEALASLEQFRAEMANNPPLRESGSAFSKRMESIAEHGIPGLTAAPFFIVVAERRGIPPVEFESPPTAWRTCGSRRPPSALAFNCFPSRRCSPKIAGSSRCSISPLENSC